MRRFAVSGFLLLGLLMNGCQGHSQFVPGGEVGLLLPDPAHDILVVFSHGSVADKEPDGCRPMGGSLFAGFSVPDMLVELPSDDPALRIYALCTRSILGDKGGLAAEAARPSPCLPDGGPQKKVCKRARAIEALLADIIKANAGTDGAPLLTSDRIFLAGTSAGAWASLLLMAEEREAPLANAVIGFAPAFAGKTPHMEDHKVIFDRHLEHLAKHSRRALLFAFEGDPYETPMTLAPLEENPQVELVDVPAPTDDPAICDPPAWRFWSTPHACAYRDAFDRSYRTRVLDFIRCRVADPLAPCRPAGV